MRNPAWDRDETILAFYLYHFISRSKISESNSSVIALSELLPLRSPGSVGKKLFNIAANDPTLIALGKKSLSHCSKLDREVWHWFDDFESLRKEAESILARTIISQYGSLEEYAKVGDNLILELVDQEPFERTYPVGNQKSSNLIITDPAPGYDVVGTTTQRRGQDLFRKMVLAGYDNKCCITGISRPELLVASHIKPWAACTEKEKTNPSNGLCLNMLHDKAFDIGLITLDDDCSIIVSPELKRTKVDLYTRKAIIDLEGHVISMPDRYLPDRELLEYHRDYIFKR